LGDPGLSQMGNTSDPYQKPFLVGKEAPRISANPRDFALYMLAHTYAHGCDLPGAEKSAAQMKTDYWKSLITIHLDQMRKLPPDVLAKRREAVLKGQNP